MARTTRIVEEEFTEVDTRTVDKRSRLTLGRLGAENRRFRISVSVRGEILLQPMEEIPASELWLYRDREALESVKRGLRDSAEGRTRKLDLKDL